MAKLGDLFVNVSAKGVGKTNAALGTTEKKASMAGKAMGMLKTAILAIGAYAVIRAIRSVITEFTDYTVQIDKFTKQTGIATDTIQKLVYAAEQEHGSLESLNKGLMNLTVRLGYAGDAQAVYIRYFDALNISYKNADGTLRDTYDVFLSIADAVSAGTLSTAELAAVMQLFGARSAKELIPLLKKGRHWFEQMGIEADNLGIVLSEKTIKQGKIFSDQMTELNTAVRGLKYAIAEDLIPTLIKLANTVQDLRPLYDFFKQFDKYWRVEIGGWSLNLANLNAQVRNLYKGLKFFGAIKDNTGAMRNASRATKELGDDFEELPPPIKGTSDALKDLLPIITSYTEILTEQERIQKLTNDAYAEAVELLYGKAAGIEVVTLAEGKAVDATNDTSEAAQGAAQILGILGSAFGSLNSDLMRNSAAFHEWAMGLMSAIAGVMIKLMAMATIVKLLEALGVPAGALLKLGSKIGLFQTPSGDMFAYREGLDFGKFFFGGIQEQFNAKLGEVSNMQRQQPTNIIVHTGDPSTFVEFVSNMPTPYKSKLHRETTLKAERIED